MRGIRTLCAGSTLQRILVDLLGSHIGDLPHSSNDDYMWALKPYEMQSVGPCGKLHSSEESCGSAGVSHWQLSQFSSNVYM